MLRNNFFKHHSITIFVFLGLLFGFSLFIIPKSAMAEQSSNTWSWSSASPIVFSSNKLTDMSPSLCPTPYQLKKIDGELESKKVCFTTDQSTGTVSFGTVAYDPWKGFVKVVGFKYDSKMYTFRGPCERYDSCLYLPGSDTLVTKQYLINGIVRSLVIYKNFTRRLSKVVNGFSLEYNFDSSNPDYVFKNADGYAWPIGGIGASDDGKWLAVEFRQRGIGLLDMETLQMKRISTMAFSYGTGYDPTSEIAVSNGGKQIAVMGMNSGFAVFDVDSGCGDGANDENMSGVSPIAAPCKKSPIDVGGFIYRFYAGIGPRFNDDGGELNFYALSYVDESREVTLRAAGYGGQKLDYLALGDSYTSGEGETDDKYYQPGTNDKFEKCHLSSRSYPYLVAGLSGISPDLMKSVACSGAKVDDVIGDDTAYSGQGKRLGKDKLKLNPEEITLAKTQAKYSYLPGRVHQEFFAMDNNSKVITIGIGGNDAGLMDKMTACAGLTDTCNWANNSKKKEQTAVEIKNVFDKLVNTYKKIHEDSPNSKIYVIGYPNIIDPDGNCDHITNQSLDKTERDFAAESVKYLNQVVEAAAKSAGVKFIDVQDSYGNQTLCGSKSPNAISGIRTGDDTNLVNDSQWFRFIGNESFHPNSIGHSLVSDSIHKSVDNLLNDSYCVDNSNICPDESIKAPEPSSYWIPDNYHGYPTQQIANYVFDSNDGTDNRQKDLVLDSYSLSPNSAVIVEVTSNPITLGNFTASSNGSFNTRVTLPAGLTEGYHTVHLYSTSYSGDPIELYQVIEFIKPVIESSKPTPNQPVGSAKKISRLDQTMFENVNLADDAASITEDYTKSEVKGDSIVVVANKQAKTANIDSVANNTKYFPVYVFVLPVIFAALIIATIIKSKKRR